MEFGWAFIEFGWILVHMNSLRNWIVINSDGQISVNSQISQGDIETWSMELQRPFLVRTLFVGAGRASKQGPP